MGNSYNLSSDSCITSQPGSQEQGSSSLHFLQHFLQITSTGYHCPHFYRRTLTSGSSSRTPGPALRRYSAHLYYYQATPQQMLCWKDLKQLSDYSYAGEVGTFLSLSARA